MHKVVEITFLGGWAPGLGLTRDLWKVYLGWFAECENRVTENLYLPKGSVTEKWHRGPGMSEVPMCGMEPRGRSEPPPVASRR